MKFKIIILFFFLLFAIEKSKAQSNDSVAIAQAKESLCEWNKYKLRVLKKISIAKDSVEYYASNKNGTDAVHIRIFKRVSKKEVENTYYYYLKGQLFLIQIIGRTQGDLGIWNDKELGFYFLKDGNLIYKKKCSFDEVNIDVLLEKSKKYYQSATVYLVQSK